MLGNKGLVLFGAAVTGTAFAANYLLRPTKLSPAKRDAQTQTDPLPAIPPQASDDYVDVAREISATRLPPVDQDTAPHMATPGSQFFKHAATQTTSGSGFFAAEPKHRIAPDSRESSFDALEDVKKPKPKQHRIASSSTQFSSDGLEDTGEDANLRAHSPMQLR